MHYSFMHMIGIYGLICKTLIAECKIKEENSGEAFICKKNKLGHKKLWWCKTGYV